MDDMDKLIKSQIISCPRDWVNGRALPWRRFPKSYPFLPSLTFPQRMKWLREFTWDYYCQPPIDNGNEREIIILTYLSPLSIDGRDDRDRNDNKIRPRDRDNNR